VTRRARKGTNTGQAVDLVNFIDSDFRVTESEVAATWMATGRSSLRGALTRIERRNEHVPQRDFSGMAGDLGYVWSPTGRLTINAGAQRLLSPYAIDTSTTYRVDKSLSLGAGWQVSEKLRLNARASRMASDFLGPVAPVAGPLRSDVLRILYVGADWTIERRVTLRGTLQRQQRSSNFSAFEFDATILGAEASLTF
jgi:hypothetical protein